MKIVNVENLLGAPMDIIDYVVGRKEPVAIERNGRIAARIVPEPRTMTAAQALDGFAMPLSIEEARKWLAGSKDASEG